METKHENPVTVKSGLPFRKERSRAFLRSHGRQQWKDDL